jgi:flavin-dependent dehydrogenase
VATLLARQGVTVALFARGKRPPIIVGESLVPAIVPFLRELGIEQEVEQYSVFKPGATFSFASDDVQSLRFDEVRGAQTPYSWNVPRDLFDASVRKAAIAAGVHVFDCAARLERVGASDRVQLSESSLAETKGLLDGQPDWIVDATGRTRLIPQLLDLPTVTGARRDTALHAHCTGIELEVDGNVHTDRLKWGWSWRIPLQGRTSVGLVMPSERLREFGDKPEAQYDAYLQHDPMTRAWAREFRRTTPVVKYTNYQLQTQRGFGDGWALVGDCFGFVDPVFSSGMLIGLDGARELARALLRGTDRALQRYERHVQRHLSAWQRVADYWYDGRLFTLIRRGTAMSERPVGRLLNFHFEKHMPRVFTGEATTKRYSLGLLDFMIRYGLYGEDPEALRVR